MRLPPNYGSVTRLSGKRRRPYMVRVSAGLSDGGKRLYEIVGYAKTRKEGLEMLAAFHEGRPDGRTAPKTLGEVYEMWSGKHYPDVSEGTARNYRAAWGKLSKWENVPVAELKLARLEEIVWSFTPGTQKMVKQLLSLLLGEAVMYDLADRNYAAGVKVMKAERKITRKVFTEDEIGVLFGNAGDPVAAAVLICIYTGLRPGEFVELRPGNVDTERWTITGGKKTAAGRDRVVPVHPRIRELVSGSPFIMGKGVSYNSYRVAFADTLGALGIPGHLPHDTRHTFATRARLSGMNDTVRKLVMGHAVPDITEGVYTHYPLSVLHEEVARLP